METLSVAETSWRELPQVVGTSVSTFASWFYFRTSSYRSLVKSIGERTIESVSPWEPYSPFRWDSMAAEIGCQFDPNSPGDEDADQIERPFHIWRLSTEACQLLRIRENDPWKLHYGLGLKALDFSFRADSFSVLLILFETGVGALVLNAAPLSALLDDWIDFIYAIRSNDPVRGGRLSAPTAAGADLWEAGDLPCPIGHFISRIQSLLVATPEEPAVRPALLTDRLIPFVGIYVSPGSGVNQDAVIQALHRLPHTGGDADRHNSLLGAFSDGYTPLSSRHGLLCTPSVAGLIHFAVSPASVPEIDCNYLRQEFLFLSLLCYAQRCKLGDLSEKISKAWLKQAASLATAEKRFKEVREEFLLFRARLYFTHPSLRELPLLFYRKLHAVLDTGSLFDEVHGAVSEMHEFLNSQKNLRFQNRVNVIAACFLVPSLGLSFLGMNINGLTVEKDGLTLGAPFVVLSVVALVAASVLGGLLWYINRD